MFPAASPMNHDAIRFQRFGKRMGGWSIRLGDSACGLVATVLGVPHIVATHAIAQSSHNSSHNHRTIMPRRELGH